MKANLVEEYKLNNKRTQGENTLELENELFSVKHQLEEDLGFSKEVFMEAKKIWDKAEFPGRSAPKEPRFVACVRLAAVKEGEPVRTKTIAEICGYESTRISDISKRIKRYADVRLFADPVEFSAFLMDRLDIHDQKTRERVKQLTERFNRQERFYSTAGTSIAMAVIVKETDVTIEEVMAETKSRKSTILRNIRKIQSEESD